MRDSAGAAKKPAPRRSIAVLVLSIAALLYCGIQWLGASTIGGNKIFSSSMAADREDFRKMGDAISSYAREACVSTAPDWQGPDKQGPDTILFDDEDVASPYLVDADYKVGGCKMVHETSVTLFTNAEMEDCHTVLVRELVPPRSEPREHRMEIDPTRESLGWTELKRWMTNDARYGFAVYGHPCMTQKGTPPKDVPQKGQGL